MYHQPIPIGSDHAGFQLKKNLISYLIEKGYETKDFGCYSEESTDYSDVAHPVAELVEKNPGMFGILICGSGNGINMTANKHQGIRSALCWNKETAILARQHNDANIIALPARFITLDEAIEIISFFLSTSFEGGRHLNRIKKIPCS